MRRVSARPQLPLRDPQATASPTRSMSTACRRSLAMKRKTRKTQEILLVARSQHQIFLLFDEESTAVECRKLMKDMQGSLSSSISMRSLIPSVRWLLDQDSEISPDVTSSESNHNDRRAIQKQLEKWHGEGWGVGRAKEQSKRWEEKRQERKNREIVT